MSFQSLLAIAASKTASTPADVEPVTTILNSLTKLYRDTLTQLPMLAASIVVLLITWLICRVVLWSVSLLFSRWSLRRSLKDLFRQLIGIGIWIVGILVAAVVLFPGMTPAKIFTVLGIGSVAVGFAFKDIFENFFAGVLILWRFPFDPGDYIECDDIAGTVEDTTIRLTTIRRTNGELVVLPNARLFKNAVRAWTNRSERRVTIICGVAYSEDVDEAREVISNAVSNCATVSQFNPVEVYACEFASSSVNFEVTWWTGSTPLDERRSRNEVICKVKRALDEAGIEIPFPYRTLTFKQPLEINRAED